MTHRFTKTEKTNYIKSTQNDMEDFSKRFISKAQHCRISYGNFIPPSPDSFHFLPAPKGFDYVASVGESPPPTPSQQPEHKPSMWVHSAQIHIVSYSKTNGRLT